MKEQAEFLNIASEIDLSNLPEPRMVGTNLTYDLKDYLKTKIKDRLPEIPVVRITDQAYDKMFAIVDECDVELAWHGTVTKEENMYTITDILLYPQEIAATTVDAIEDLYGDWLMGLNDNVFNSLRMQGHSHVNMGITPSGTDETYYKELLSQVTDFYIVLIVNKARKAMVRLYDVTNNLLITELDLLKESTLDNNAWAKEQLKEYTVKKTYTPSKVGSAFDYGHGVHYSVSKTTGKHINDYPGFLTAGSKKKETSPATKGKENKNAILSEGTAIYINEMFGSLTTLPNVQGTVLLGYGHLTGFTEENTSSMPMFDVSTNTGIAGFLDFKQILMPERNVSLYLAALLELTYTHANRERYVRNVNEFDAEFSMTSLIKDDHQFAFGIRDEGYKNIMSPGMRVSEIEDKGKHLVKFKSKYIAVGGAS